MISCSRFCSVGVALVALTVLAFAGCGRSDPLPCKNQCKVAGESRCWEDTVQTCNWVDDWCLAWIDMEDCAADDSSCLDDEHGVRCIRECDECTEPGESRCQTNTIQVCTQDENKCLVWASVVNCSYYDEQCEVVDSVPRCTATCEDECDSLGSKRCSGAVVETCLEAGSGCLEWRATEVCEDGEVCEQGQLFTQCVPACSDACPQRGETRCEQNTVVVCAMQESGCLDWELDQDCALTAELCTEGVDGAFCGPCDPNCDGRQCGPDPICGVDCGQCQGPTELCREEQGICEDVCAGVECGLVEGIACGTCTPEEVCIAGVCYGSVCEGEMCHVPEGTFWMGCNEAVDPFCDEDEYPYHEVTLDAYLIDRLETTQAEYFDCILDGECAVPAVDFDPETYPNFPVVRVIWEEADDYCTWRGKRLCTEAEWEKAARGTDGRRYPWGNEAATCDRAIRSGCGFEDAVPPGTLPAGQSPYGVQDMAGNVWEWVADRYEPDSYSQCEGGCTNPFLPYSGAPGQGAVLRGGDVYSWSDYIRTSKRYGMSLDNRCGIRCCMSVP